MGHFVIILLSIITGFYFIGLILRVFFRFWLKRKMKQFEKSGGFTAGFGGFSGSGGPAGGAYSSFRGNGNSATSSENNGRREGEIKVTATGEEQKRIKDKVGEYIEFDEVK